MTHIPVSPAINRANGQRGARRISEQVLYDRALDRQKEEDELRIAVNKMTAHITCPGSPAFAQRYAQNKFGTRRDWGVKDLNEMAIEAEAPDEDCLAFAHAYLAWVEQRLAIRDKRRENEPNLQACLTSETIVGAKQDIAVAQELADPSIAAVQKVFDTTLKLERRERGLLKACRAVLASRGLRHLTVSGGVKTW